ncbi:LacI family DNA-binding transcriptional regulator [Nesterenkonia muleiensis]|uniref:LacI family DNA-binding transcriptional regulator n=1 Tax=Nesterenkonia muleiensis TaxID=2282648 RepID=UPI000E751DA3|nr:LacI family DNA-binding transcriptional regulator [Nesterenkonia muleiensis]
MTQRLGRTITQRGLAELAGVSIATVSRVLSAPQDQRGRWASPETVSRILELANELGYKRNPHAASLRTSRSDLVGVLVPRLQDFVLATIYEGIEEAGMELGINTYVMNSHDDVELQRLRTQVMLDRRVDGLIFGDARLDAPFLDELREQGVPFVLTSRRKEGHLSITCDDYAGGRMVAEHLIEQGRTDVVILGGLEFASTAQDRTHGLIDRLREAGIEVPPERIVYRGFDTAAGRQAMAEILEDGISTNAVFAANDFAAIGALGVLQDHGYSVPGDVALIGYNDTPLAESVGIPLTTIRSPMHPMGRESLLTLCRLMAGEPVESQRLAPELIVRASSRG